MRREAVDFVLIGGQEPMETRLEDNSNVFRGIPPYFLPYGKDFMRMAGRAYSFPAYALPILAACVAKAKGTAACINDFYAETPETLERAVRRARLGIGISTTFLTNAGSIAKIVAFARKAAPSVPVILGGAGVINNPAVRKTADITVWYEGEETMADLVRALRGRSAIDSVAGISYVRRGKERMTRERQPIRDLGTIPVPAWDRLAQKAKSERYLPIESSRGCIGSCSFCLERQYWPGVRLYPVGRVIRELEKSIAAFGVRHYYFQDSNISNKRSYLAELCDEMRSRKLGIFWSCESRIDTVSKESIDRMYDAGCRAVTFGMESADPVVLRNMNKGLHARKLDEFAALVRHIRRRGMVANINIIIGFPGEDRASIARTADFLLAARPAAYSMSKFFLERGTDIWKRRKEFGLSGAMYDWRHRTMQGSDLDRLIRETFLRVSGSSDVCHWTSASVDLIRHMSRGASVDDFIRYLRAVNRICVEDLTGKNDGRYSRAYDANFRYITRYLERQAGCA